MDKVGVWLALVGAIIFGLMLLLELIDSPRTNNYSARGLALGGFLVGLGVVLIHHSLL